MPGRWGLRLVRPAVLFLAFAAATPVAATPVSITQDELDPLVAGLAVVFERFEDVAVSGYPPPPSGIANGPFGSFAPRVDDAPELCDNMAYCLRNHGSITGTGTFTALPDGAQPWGADVFPVDTPEKLQPTVMGAAEFLEPAVSGSGFVGFAAREGLLLVAFQSFGADQGGGSGGMSNYGSGKISTGALAFLLGGALMLLGCAIAGVWAVRRWSRSSSPGAATGADAVSPRSRARPPRRGRASRAYRPR